MPIVSFRMDGALQAVTMHKAVGMPGRRMEGWLTVFGHLGPGGGVIPVVDRDGQTMDAARELGHIDWTHYLSKGAWNDTHDESILVGRSTGVEFHDGTTDLSKAYGNRVGFWTTGLLFDREDEESWGDFAPSEQSFQRADHFWNLAKMLKGGDIPRPLGFSAHGDMAVSPCGSRILWARIKQAAVCEVPVNPASTAELAKGFGDVLTLALRKGGKGRITDDSPCKSCSCPPGGCQLVRVRKAVTAESVMPTVPEDLEGVAHGDQARDVDTPLKERVITQLMKQYKLSREDAERFLADHIKNRTGRQAA